MMNKFFTYYSINAVINCEIESTNPFIIANEIMRVDNSIARSYTIFNSFQNFIDIRYKFPYCHEIIVDHTKCQKSSDPSIDKLMREGGRLVFDIDVAYNEYPNIPDNIQDQIEIIIKHTFNKYYIDIDCDNLDYVWSHCNNPIKLSMHLTVKNILFDNWISMSKFFYGKFVYEWNKHNEWINGNDLIDKQIVKKRTSLRMVGSSKINGNKLVFKDDYCLKDSLIRIYSESDINQLDVININRIKNKYQNQLTTISTVLLKSNNSVYYSNDSNDSTISINPKLFGKLFFLINSLIPNIFRINKINGNIIQLTRLKSAKCLLSDKIHEKENAYLIIKPIDIDQEYYEIIFGCYRQCNLPFTIGKIHV